MTPDAIADALLDAWGHGSDDAHRLEAELEAACGGYRPASYAILAARQRRARHQRRPYVAPFDPGLVLARRLDPAAPSSPAPQRPSPRRVAPWRVGGDLALVALVVGVPLAAAITLGRFVTP